MVLFYNILYTTTTGCTKQRLYPYLYVVYLKMLSVTHSIQHQMIGWQ